MPSYSQTEIHGQSPIRSQNVKPGKHCILADVNHGSLRQCPRRAPLFIGTFNFSKLHLQQRILQPKTRHSLINSLKAGENPLEMSRCPVDLNPHPSATRHPSPADCHPPTATPTTISYGIILIDFSTKLLLPRRIPCYPRSSFS